MPGERAGTSDGPVLQQVLLALRALDARFRGFAHDSHGVARGEHGVFSSACLSETSEPGT
jgi:hypothetical protein